MNTMDHPTEMLLTVAGLGHRRPFPGTWGSIPPVVIAGVLIAAGLGPGSTLAWIYFAAMALLAVVFTLVCVLLGIQAEAKWGKDPSQVVADEVAGQSITLMFIPAGVCVCPMSTIWVLLGAFVLFRAFDILKPWPAGAVQRIAGGWGVVLDDLIAGVMAGVAMLIVLWIL
ncbi:MAG: phosphatidylglycerophosphatase A [Phycisphaerales bacterium]